MTRLRTSPSLDKLDILTEVKTSLNHSIILIITIVEPHPNSRGQNEKVRTIKALCFFSFFFILINE